MLLESDPTDIKSRHISAIVYKGRIIAIGRNKIKSHPFQKRFSANPNKIYLHSEVECIHKSLKKITVEQLKKSTLYVIRLMADGSLGNSKPCDGCNRCIATFGIKNVIHS